MLSWFRSLTTRSLPPPPVSEEAPERPPWVDELIEMVQKQTRATTKQSARLEGALAELDGRVTQLGEGLKRPAPTAAPARALNFDPVFDALDSLDAAQALAAEPNLAEGLSRVTERLVLFCQQNGYRREAGLGMAPDARVMRVVGTERSDDLPPGRISRVVRAAVLRGSELVREGSVIVASEENDDGQRLGN